MLNKLKSKNSEDAAKWGSKLLLHAAKKGFSDVSRVKKLVLSARPYDITTHNAVEFLTHNLKKREILLPEISHRAKLVDNYFDDSDFKIAALGNMRIKKGMTIATYGNSLLVLQIILQSQRQGKNIIVNTIGNGAKALAEKLAKEKVKVIHFEDNSARLALKHSDLLMIGCHAISRKGHAIAAIGSELCAEAALAHGCKVYVVCHGWKYDSENIFKHDESKEVKKTWQPRGVVLNRFRYETLKDNSFTAIITEAGVHRPGYFVKEITANYPWMKKSWLR